MSECVVGAGGRSLPSLPHPTAGRKSGKASGVESTSQQHMPAEMMSQIRSEPAAELPGMASSDLTVLPFVVFFCVGTHVCI